MFSAQKISEQNPKNALAGKSKPFFPAVIQKKLSIGSAHDSYEVEADKVADQVMRKPELSSKINHSESLVQRKCAACAEEEKIHRKPLAESISPLIQRKSTESSGIAPSHIENQINSSKGGGNAMDNSTRNFMENRFGADFSDVRIHTGREAAQMNRDLSSQAFAVGNDIYFNDGKFIPNSYSGKHLLAHELTHTVQQNGGVGRKIQKWDMDNAPIGDPDRDVRLREFRTRRRVASSIAELPLSEKLSRSLIYSLQYLPSEIGARIRELLTPESLAIMAAFLTAYIVSQFTPAGWVTDIIVAGLIVATLFMIGPEVITIIRELMAFGSTANNARSEADLERAGRHFSTAVSRIGIDVIMAIIFHRIGRSAVTEIRNIPPPPDLFSQMVTPDGMSMPIPSESVPISNRPLQMSASRPSTGRGSAIDSLVGEGSEISRGMSERTASGAGASRPPRHHVFAQEFRPWFERRGFTRRTSLDIDNFTIEMSQGEHQATHGGGDWQLARDPSRLGGRIIEWNARLMADLRAAESAKGSLLNFAEIYEIGLRLMAEYRLGGPENFVPFRD